MAKPDAPLPDCCGRCGHPKSEHVLIVVENVTAPDVLLCPTALYAPDPLPALFDDETRPAA